MYRAKIELGEEQVTFCQNTIISAIITFFVECDCARFGIMLPNLVCVMLMHKKTKTTQNSHKIYSNIVQIYYKLSYALEI